LKPTKSIGKPEDEEIQKAFDGMDQHNAWDFETQYKFCSN
jgi:ATP-binding cassette subfamily F protein uup